MFLNISSVKPALANGDDVASPSADRQKHRGDERRRGSGLAIAGQEKPTAEQSYDQGIAVGVLGRSAGSVNRRSKLRRFVPKRRNR